MEKPRLHGRDLRKGRYSESGRIYFVTTCCAQRRNLFSVSRNARIVAEELDCTLENEQFKTLAYVVMPDHIHALIQLTGKKPLHKAVGSFKGRSARRINQDLEDKRRVWQAGFHDHALRSEEDLETVANYLIQNPVRAGLVAQADDYPFWDSVWHCRRAFRPEDRCRRAFRPDRG